MLLFFKYIKMENVSHNLIFFVLQFWFWKVFKVFIFLGEIISLVITMSLQKLFNLYNINTNVFVFDWNAEAMALFPKFKSN